MKTYQVSLTKKGQMTIPKEIREKLDLSPGSKVSIEFDEDNKSIKLEQKPDIMDMFGMIEAPEGKDALKSREYMEENYDGWPPNEDK